MIISEVIFIVRGLENFNSVYMYNYNESKIDIDGVVSTDSALNHI